MKHCLSCHHIIEDDHVFTCPRCGESIFGEFVFSMDFSYDDAEGSIVVNNIRYFASDIVEYSIKLTNNKAKLLVIDMPNNLRIGITTGRPTLFKGYGETGKQIDLFEKKLPKLLRAGNTALRSQVQAGKLPRVSTVPEGVILQNGEYAIHVSYLAKYRQECTETSYYQSSINTNIWDNTSIGSGDLTPETRTYLAELDRGKLILTNRKLLFVGKRNSMIVPFEKILAVKRYDDGIAITTPDSVKQIFFSVIDGHLYADMILHLLSLKKQI